MKKLTYGRFMALPSHEKTKAYFSHELNTRVNPRNRSEGPTTEAQGRFTNNAAAAFTHFADQLPAN